MDLHNICRDSQERYGRGTDRVLHGERQASPDLPGHNAANLQQQNQGLSRGHPHGH